MQWPDRCHTNLSTGVGQTRTLANAAVRSLTGPEVPRFGAGGVRLSPIIGGVPNFPDGNTGDFGISSASGTRAVGGITTAATGSFLSPSIPNHSHSTLMRAIGTRHGVTTLTLIILTIVRSMATKICRQWRSSQMSRPSCITRVITTDPSMVSLARTRVRQSRIIRPITALQLPPQLQNRQSSYWAWSNGFLLLASYFPC